MYIDNLIYEVTVKVMKYMEESNRLPETVCLTIDEISALLYDRYNNVYITNNVHPEIYIKKYKDGKKENYPILRFLNMKILVKGIDRGDIE